ncbi:hypothetical protein BaRGS_00008528 [Batillaria attramentaria]|uniref:Calcineurin-like phosphoesterase domain-containing protein n=1 Tax=Batillaria attramentaria TaxID=370345 RepID=A0ABD0LLE1_9CAEN
MEAPTGRRKLYCGLSFSVLFLVGELYVYSLHFETRAKVLRAHFVVLLQVIFYFISKFIWKSLNSKRPVSAEPGEATFVVEEDPKYLTLWKKTLLGYLILCHSAYLTNYFLMGRDPHWFSLLAYCAIGSYIQLAFALVVLKVVNFGVCTSEFYLRGPSRRERLFSKRTVAFLACFYAAVTSCYAFYSASQMPTIKRVQVPIRGLPEIWENTRIVQLSDIHLGPTVGFTRLSRIVDVVTGLRPDIVVMTGDLVDGPVTSLKRAASPLVNVWSKLGNYFVTGNHEYYTGDVDNWLQTLRVEINFHPLHNSNVKLIPPDGKDTDAICLAGTDDPEAHLMGYTGHGPDLDRALKTCDQTQPVILLTHQPRAAKAALHSPYRIDLVLAGHTHGGQFIPMNLGAYFLNPFFAGLYEYKNSHVYVSQGTQFFGIPFRMGSTMEITEITLYKARKWEES